MYSKNTFMLRAMGQTWWLDSHASSTELIKFDDEIATFFITGRDADNRSHIGKMSYDFSTNTLIGISSEPEFSLGPLGSFDEFGASYPALLGNRLFYTGWTKGVATPFFNNLGFVEFVKGECIRSQRLPIAVCGDSKTIGIGSTCFFKDSQFIRMYYTAFESWDLSESYKHVYSIKMAKSLDGRLWEGSGEYCIPLEEGEYSNCRPSVIHYKNNYHMWFSSKYEADKYCIKYARSRDLEEWTRIPLYDVMLDPSCSFANSSQSYPTAFKMGRDLKIVFAGNNYGQDGVGYISLNLDMLQ